MNRRQITISKNITQRGYKSLGKYFNEVDKIDLITTQEEILLARKTRVLRLKQLIKNL
ncbi:sigma-70 factor domain-containing protein [Mucilaginibacter sp. McL0603]|uniref:sigma-70 factor domain-containing protein n=1 Tax=Mucilaginibacter sp. McL0603 TaxID=3415670 RepID=UPI003CF8C28D